MVTLHASRRHWLQAALAGAALRVWPHAQASTTYPHRAIKLVVPFAPGGSSDILARLLAQALHTELGQPVYIENKPGAGGLLGTQAVAQSTPDGYVLGLGSISSLAVNPVVLKASRLDPLRDLQMVAPLVSIASVFSTHPSLGITDFASFVQAARSQSEPWTAGSSGMGSIGHVILEAFNAELGVQLRHIPFKGMGPVVNSALAGHTQVLSDQFPSSAPYVQAGRLHPFAVAAQTRLPQLPQVPTLSELGHPALNALAITWFGLVAPAGTPAPVVQRLNAAVNRALQQAAVLDRLATLGTEALGGSPEDLQALVQRTSAQVQELVRTRGITDGL